MHMVCPGLKRYAIIGGGLAGVSVAWHLLAAATPAQPICIHLYDKAGIAGGASGAAAGLLHPLTPKGKASPSLQLKCVHCRACCRELLHNVITMAD